MYHHSKLFSVHWLTFILFSVSQCLHAQNPVWDWADQLKMPAGTELTEIKPMSNGDWVVAGYVKNSPVVFMDSTFYPENYQGTDTAQGGFVVIRVDSLGNLRWFKLYGSHSFFPNQPHLATDTSGNIIFSFYTFLPTRFSATVTNSHRFGVVKLSGQGEVLNIWNPPVPYTGYIDTIVSVKTDLTGNVFVAWRGYSGYYDIGFSFPPTDSENIIDGYLVKLSPQLLPLWAKQLPTFETATSVVKQNGDCVIQGFFQNPVPDWNLNQSQSQPSSILVTYSNSGQVLSATTFYNDQYPLTHLSERPGGGLNGAGFFYKQEQGSFSFAHKVIRFGANGRVDWAREVLTHQNDYNVSPGFFQKPDGSMLVSGPFSGYVSINGQLFLPNNSNEKFYSAQFNEEGNVDWVSFAGGYGIASSQNGTIAVTGSFLGNLEIENLGNLVSSGAGDGFIASAGRFQNLAKNKISGTIFLDSLQNCTKDAGEPLIENWLVHFSPQDAYLITDSSGYFEAFVNQGTFQIQAQPPYPLRSFFTDTTCFPLGRTVVLDTLGVEIADQNFPVNANDFNNYFCNQASINVSMGFVRPCVNTQFTINYQNHKYIFYDSVVIEILLPELLMYVSSSQPFSSMGDNRFRLTLRNIPPLGSDIVQVVAQVDCQAVNFVGLSQCVQVNLLGVNPCLPPPGSNWDGVELKAGAECVDDAVIRLWVANTSSENMADSVEYRIYNTQGLAFTGKLKLAAEDSLVLLIPAGGQSLRIEVDQTEGHPGGRWTSATVENCGIGNFRSGPGLQTLMPTYDALEVIGFAEACSIVTNSLDPNDKLGTPIGLGEFGAIDVGIPLNFQIRFQNTGNDTAFRVVLVDTLSSVWDLSTFRETGHSHTCRWKIEGLDNQTLKVWFDPILLPDSTTNRAASEGYFSYSVAPKQGLPLGTQLTNEADIYFDFNEPVRTNTTLHTLGLPIAPDSSKIRPVVCQDDSLWAFAGFDQSLCGPDSVVIQAEQPAGTIGFWTVYSGQNLIQDPGSALTYFSRIEPGSYSFEWRVYGCSSSVADSSGLAIYPALNTPSIALKDPTHLEAIFTGSPTEFEWRLNDTWLPENRPVLEVFESGDYTVRMSEHYCWSSFSDAFNLSLYQSPTFEVVCFPNPTTGEFAISIQADGQTSVEVWLFDLRDQLIFNEVIEINSQGKGFTLANISGLSQGLYLLVVKGDGEKIRKKIRLD